MTRYIDKDALVAEIKRKLHFINNWIEGDKRRQMHTNGVSSAYYKMIGSKHACESILDFVNTLEVKEVDLNEEIEKCLKQHSMLAVGKKDFTDIAKHFYSLGLAQKGE